MNESTTTSRQPMAGLPPNPRSAADGRGVRGWLLVLCLMLTVVGPAISAWLMASRYADVAPFVSMAFGPQVSLLASWLLTASAVAFGAYAGLRLWLIRPNAVETARNALLFGLAVDIVTTALDVAAEQVPGNRLLFQVTADLVPSLVFFMLSFSYLDRSKRVSATYGS